MAAASLPKNKVMYGLDASKYPSRMGQSWKKEEVTKLLTSIQEKKSIEEIAKDHDRTEGGIRSYLNKIAVDFHLKDNKPMEEIQKVTGLTEEQIKEALKRHETKESVKESAKTLRLETKEALKVTTTEKDPEDRLPSMLEVVTLLKDIQRKLNLLLEKVE